MPTAQATGSFLHPVALLHTTLVSNEYFFLTEKSEIDTVSCAFVAVIATDESVYTATIDVAGIKGTCLAIIAAHGLVIKINND